MRAPEDNPVRYAFLTSVFILLLINDVRLVGHLKNTRFYHILGWGTFAMIFRGCGHDAGQILGLFGIQLFGA
jgi:hypothetical protein